MEYMESMMDIQLEGSISEYEQMSERIKQLEQELAEAKKDQARYQWIRKSGDEQETLLFLWETSELDTAIDAAIKESSK